jgi:hypothetical protein
MPQPRHPPNGGVSVAHGRSAVTISEMSKKSDRKKRRRKTERRKLAIVRQVMES